MGRTGGASSPGRAPLVTALAWTEDSLVGLPGLGQAPYGQYLREAARRAWSRRRCGGRGRSRRARRAGARPRFPRRRAAERSQTAELLVVGDQGRGRIASAVAGSVALGVAARSACPVVVVRGTSAIPDGAPVVVGIDGTPLSEAAIPFAFDAAAARHVPLVAVHTWLDEINDPALAELVDWQTAAVRAEEVLAERLAGWERSTRTCPVQRLVARGRAGRALLDQAARRSSPSSAPVGTAKSRGCCSTRSATPWCTGRAARSRSSAPPGDHRGAAPPRTPLEHEEDTMQAQDLMNRTVVTVRPHMPVGAAAVLLVSRGVTSAPVVTAEGVLRGMVSEVDLLRAQPMPDALTTTPECRAHGSRRDDPQAGRRCGLPTTWPMSRPFCSTTVSARRPSSRANGSSASSAATTSWARRTAATGDRARRQAGGGERPSESEVTAPTPHAGRERA